MIPDGMSEEEYIKSKVKEIRQAFADRWLLERDITFPITMIEQEKTMKWRPPNWELMKPRGYTRLDVPGKYQPLFQECFSQGVEAGADAILLAMDATHKYPEEVRKKYGIIDFLIDGKLIPVNVEVVTTFDTITYILPPGSIPYSISYPIGESPIRLKECDG